MPSGAYGVIFIEFVFKLEKEMDFEKAKEKVGDLNKWDAYIFANRTTLMIGYLNLLHNNFERMLLISAKGRNTKDQALYNKKVEKNKILIGQYKELLAIARRNNND